MRSAWKGCGLLTNSGIGKDDERVGVVDPLNLEPAPVGLPLRERRDNVASLELDREVGKSENASD